jgi:hypothetical protein
MLRDRMFRAAQTAAIAASFVFIFAIVALAQDRRQNAPGEFVFYVLAPVVVADLLRERQGAHGQ